MGDLGRMLVIVGGLLLLFGVVLIFAGKVNLPIGRLPGDIVYRGKHTTIYFPLATSIVLSVVLSVLLYLMVYGNTIAALFALLILQMDWAAVIPRWAAAEAAVTGLFAAACAVALLLWKRWAVYAATLLYGGWAMLSLYASFHSPWGFSGRVFLLVNAGRLLVIAGLVLLGMRRQWRYLE